MRDRVEKAIDLLREEIREESFSQAAPTMIRHSEPADRAPGSFSPGSFLVRPYGYLESVEVSFGHLLPNMDASSHYEIAVTLIGPDGRTIPIAACYAHCRSVK